MSRLFSSLSFRNLTLPNRVVIAPMCQYSATDGSVGDWHKMHYGQLAISGAGMLILEATAVSAVGRISPGCLGLYHADNVAAMARLVQFLRGLSPGSAQALIVQIAHAGRKASSEAPWNGGMQIPISEPGGWQAIGPSAITHLPDEEPPTAMTEDDIERVFEQFVEAGRKAARSGFDGIELHAAHGYLLHQFLSPVANRRTDQYGGTPENRMRLPLRILQALRAELPADMIIGVRISATDWDSASSWDIKASTEFASACESAGADWIHVSSGGVSHNQKITLKPGYQVDMAREIKAAVSVPVIAVGLITEASHAEQIIAEEQADLVALARGFLYNPRWVWHAAAELGGIVTAPEPYWRSEPRGVSGTFRESKIGMR